MEDEVEKQPERLPARGCSKEGLIAHCGEGGTRVGCGGVGSGRGNVSTVLKPNLEAHEDHRGTHMLTDELLAQLC